MNQHSCILYICTHEAHYECIYSACALGEGELIIIKGHANALEGGYSSSCAARSWHPFASCSYLQFFHDDGMVLNVPVLVCTMVYRKDQERERTSSTAARCLSTFEREKASHVTLWILTVEGWTKLKAKTLKKALIKVKNMLKNIAKMQEDFKKS